MSIEVVLSPKERTVWLSQSQIAELFQTSRSNITMHIGNIIAEGELESSVCQDFLHTAQDGELEDGATHKYFL